MKNKVIKFRAWVKDKKIMDKVQEIKFGKDVVLGEENSLQYVEPMDNVVLMQYADLKDKNGREIYERDTVKTPFGVGKVFMRLGCWFVENQKELGYLPSCEVEVIGNIYENPELLKEEK